LSSKTSPSRRKKFKSFYTSKDANKKMKVTDQKKIYHTVCKLNKELFQLHLKDKGKIYKNEKTKKTSIILKLA
jgi:hypothetical protein